jgi:DNA replication and repair protein RecF
VIAVKIALLQLITKFSKQKPILLLDDILSELDEENQKIFLSNLPKENQIIMTSVKEIKNTDKIQTIKIEGEMQLG